MNAEDGVGIIIGVIEDLNCSWKLNNEWLYLTEIDDIINVNNIVY